MNTELKPFTVIVEFNDPEDHRSREVTELHVTASSEVRAKRIAIDSLIKWRGIECDEEDMDTWRADYTALYVYEGHLYNLAN